MMRCPAVISPVKAGSCLADRCHWLASLLPPPAAVGFLPYRDPWQALGPFKFETTKIKRPKPNGFGLFMELLARFVCICARECAQIKVRLGLALAGGAHPHRI